MVAEAEATASLLVDNAKMRAEEDELAAQERAQERSTEILNQSQERLDLILATERRTHERLLAALAEVQTAVVDGQRCARAAPRQPARRRHHRSATECTVDPAQFEQFTPVTARKRRRRPR